MSKLPKHLVDKINSIPTKPGVYLMKDSNGNIIYIGKSKTLKSRVKSYFNREHKWNKINMMVFHIYDLDYIVTDTHLEAQILECALIKKNRPIYNKQFKNDKNYKYLKIEDCCKTKPITIVDEREDKRCFGPYRSRNMLLNITDFFEKIYPILKFEDTYNFTYNIILEPMNKDSFEENKECLIEIFSRKECMQSFSYEIEAKMKLAASKLQFELASIYRNMLKYIRYLHDYNIKYNNLTNKRILIGEKIEDGYKIFYISNARIIFKTKLKKVTKEIIEKFLIETKKFESNTIQIKNEKSFLDFKHIIHSEIQDETAKAILDIDNNYNLDKFIKKLTKNTSSCDLD